MKRGTYVLIILLIFLFLIAATVVSFFYIEFSREPSIKTGSYLEIDLAGDLPEKTVPGLFPGLFFMKPSVSMFDLWMNIRKAKADNRIQAIALRLNMIGCNWAKANEIREMILDFRQSGKKVYAYIQETMDFDKEYYIATACDEIVMHPLGQLVINGIGGHILFFKNTLNKLGIEAEVEHIGEYKTAFNMFTEEKFTPAHREAIEAIYGDFYEMYIQKVAEARDKEVKEVREIIDHGFFQGSKALDAGLVDQLLFEDEFQQLISRGQKKVHKISHDEYLKINPSSLGLNQGKKFALIYGMGTIHSGEGYSQSMGGQTIARWLRKAREDKSIAAVIFRVDSPGGSAVGSDIIWREVSLTKKEKPVIVSMSDMAGSGGYWISMSAHKIIAQPQTLTGSIGVIFGKFNTIELFEKLGITSEKIEYGKRSGLFSSLNRLDEEEGALLNKEISWVYEKFLEKVADGRKMTKEDVHKIGKGRVWTGRQAQERGLVDDLGGLSRAIELAKEMLGLPASEEVRLVIWPKKVSFLSLLLGKKPASLDTALIPGVKKILNTYRFLRNESVWAIMPYFIEAD